MSEGIPPPTPDRSQRLPFHALRWEEFEDICAFLLDGEKPGIIRAERLGRGRDDQYGIDVLGYVSGGGQDGVSCKKYGTLKKGQIPAFSEEFTKYWEGYWKPRGFRRFNFATSADIRAQARVRELETEEKRFHQLGLQYEVWGPLQLERRIREDRALVEKYFGEEWADRVCGKKQPPSAPDKQVTLVIEAAISTQLSQLQSIVSGDTARRLDELADALKRGKSAEVDRELKQIRSQPVRWSALDKKAQCRILRLQATREIAKRNYAAASILIEEAERDYGDTDTHRVKSLFAFRKTGPSDALSQLGPSRDRDTELLRAALLLSTGQLEAASDVLRRLEADSESDAEWHRLAALSHLLTRDRENSLVEIFVAEKLKGEWIAVRDAGLRIRYQLALSPSAPVQHGGWPNPVSRELVDDSDVSRQHLTRALEIVEGLIEATSGALDEQSDYEVWKLACLCNLRERSVEAEDFARKLLDRDHTNAGAVAWSLDRGFSFRRSKTRKSLSDLMRSKTANCSQILALVAIDLDEGKAKRAKENLEAAREIFISSGEDDLFRHWEAILASQLQRRPPYPGDEQNQIARFRWAVTAARKSQNWAPLVENVAAAIFDVAQHPRALGGLQILAQGKRWHEIDRFRDFLVATVRTSSSVTLACLAAAGAGKHDDAISIAESNTSLFSGGQLPLEVRRIVAQSRQAMGHTLEAAELTEALALQTMEPEDMLTAATARLALGDLEGALTPLRKAARSQKISAHAAIGLARLVRIVDPDLARELFEVGTRGSVAPSLAPLAMTVASGLGMERQFREFSAVIGEIARAGKEAPVRALTIDEVPEVLRNQANFRAKAYERYLIGELPIHYVSDIAFRGLPALIIPALSAAADGPSNTQPALLLAQGNTKRTNPLREREAASRLIADLSSLIVASELGILDRALEVFGEIYVGFSLPSCLLEIEESLLPIQPVRIDAMKTILRAVADGRALSSKTIDAAGLNSSHTGSSEPNREVKQLARAVGATLVTFETSPEDEVSPDDSRSCNLRRIFDVMRDAGVLADSDHTSFIESLGELGKEASGYSPAMAGKMLFDFNTIESVALVGAFDAVVGAFSVYVDERYLQVAAQELEVAANQSAIGASLQRLRQKVTQEIKSGRIRQLPAPPADAPRKLKDRESFGPSSHLLEELLLTPLNKADIVWIDDRMIGQFGEFNGARLCGSMEVIEHLFEGGSAAESERYLRLLKLRRAGTFVLPISPEEVLFHLKRSPRTGANLASLPDLITLRRYFGTQCLFEPNLRLNPGDPRDHLERTDELHSAAKLFQLPGQLVTKIWALKDEDVATKKFWASWVWDTLRTDLFTRVPLHNKSLSSDIKLLALRYASLISGVIDVGLAGTTWQQARSIRAEYVKFLSSTIIDRVFDSDPTLCAATAEHLSELLCDLVDTDASASSVERRAARFLIAVIHDVFDLLPEVLRNALLERENFSKIFGMRSATVVTFDEIHIEAAQFWPVVLSTLKTGSAVVRSVEKQEIRVRSIGDITVELVPPHGKPFRVADLGIQLLKVEGAARREILNSHPEWFDCSRDQAEERKNAVLHAGDIAGVMRELDRARRVSRENQYRLFTEDCRIHHRINGPIAESATVAQLMAHLRLSSSDIDWATACDRAASDLIGDLGLEDSFLRLASIPAPMPQLVLDKISQFSRPERTQFIQRLTEKSLTPLRRVHTIRIVAQFFDDADGMAIAMESLISGLTAVDSMSTDTFRTVLLWAERTLSVDSEWWKLPVPQRIATAWVHADRILACLEEVGAPLPEIRKIFASRDRMRPNLLLASEHDYRSALGTPQTFSTRGFLARGLAWATEPLKDRNLLPTSARENLRAHLLLTGEGVKLPVAEVLRRDHIAPNPLRSFLATNPASFFLSIVESAPSLQFDDNSVRQYLASAVKDMRERGRVQDLFLFVLFESYEIGSDLSVSVDELVNHFDPQQLAGDPGGNSWFILQRLVQMALKSSSELKSALADKAMALAKGLRSRPERSDDTDDLVNTIVALSRDDDLSAAVGAFSTMAVRAAEQYPASADLFRSTAMWLAENLPVEVASGLWETINRLRTFPRAA